MENLKKKNRSLENEVILLNALLEAIDEILEDKQTSEFLLSFPTVRKVYDLKKGDEER